LKKGFLVLFCALMLLSVLACKNNNSSPIKSINSHERMAWFKEAKFGLFIHWGPYSNLAGEWNGKQVPVGENAEWVMQKLKIPREEYRELARSFNPIEFDAKKWVKLAKSTGMKYLVITSKHHDGFAMYHSQVSKYNIVDWTPYNRDPLKELAEECQKNDIKFCIYYSHREDWDEPFAYGNTWDFDFDPEKNLDLFESKYLNVKAKPQMRELIKNYGPFGLIWFDRGLYTPQQAQDFVKLCRDLQPDIIVNGRVGHYGQELQGDYQNMNDNGMPIGGIEEYWETPQTLNDTWGFSKFDKLWKSPHEVIGRLVEIVSAGGNYLLNVGLTGEGVVPQHSVEILNTVGKWMQTNGKAIYGTTASPFPKLPWGNCTVRGNKLYIIVLRPPPDGKLMLPGLLNKVFKVRQIDNKKLEFSFNKEGNDVFVEIPADFKPQSVLVAELDGPPKVAPPVVSPDSDGSILLDYVSASTHGRTKKRFNREGKFHISKWQNKEDYVSWKIQIQKPGMYRPVISYAARENSKGNSIVLSAGDFVVRHQLNQTGEWYEFKEIETGELHFSSGGEFEIILRLDQSTFFDLFYFKSIKLVPMPKG
jgi:alpha-L-fucosidase